MRTDSTRVSEQALDEVRDYIGQAYGKEFLPEKPNRFRAKKDAQDAHEAIRPTAVDRESGQRQGASEQGAVILVPIDLEPIRGIPDATGQVRRHDCGR